MHKKLSNVSLYILKCEGDFFLFTFLVVSIYSRYMKLAWLTWLRGLAALIVVYYHLSQYRSNSWLSQLSWDIYQFTEHLVFVVSIFFIFSAFFRSLSYWKTWNTHIEAPKFLPSLRDRFFRIAPVYYLTLILAFSFVIFWQGFSLEWLIRLFSGFTFLSWVSPQTFFPVDIDGPLWFIAYDMIGWIFVSALMTYAVRFQKIWQIFWLFFVTFLSLIGLHFLWIALPWPHIPGIAGEWFPTYNPFLFGLHFIIGAVLWGVIEWMRRNKRENHYIFDIVAILSLFFLGYFLWMIRDAWDWEYSWPHWPYHFPFTLIGIAWLMLSLPYSLYVWKLLDTALLSYIARISYSLYVSHMLIIFTVRKYIFTDTLLSWFQWIYFSSLSLCLSLIVAYSLNRWIENRDWMKKWKTPE